MDGRLKGTAVALAVAGALLVSSAMPLAAQEISGRFRVLIPNLEPQGQADKNFGKEVATDVRKLIDQLLTHQSVDDREVKKALRRFKLKEEELNCIRSRQLATQINAELVMCGEYTPTAVGYRVETRFINAKSGEEFRIPTFEVGKGEAKQAAERIQAEFGNYMEQLRYAQFCSDYLTSQQWENAVSACERAIELNPASVSSRYNRAQALWKMERLPDALDEVKKVLELNPIHEAGLQLAGYLSAQLGHEDDARRYYNDYLELNPGDAAVRMKIAYDLAQAGDPVGAVGLIEEGIALDSANITLYEQLGNFALSAAARIAEQAGGANGNLPPPEAIELFEKALRAYDRVYAQKGQDTDVSILRNMMAANMQLQNYNRAIEIAEQALATHRDEAQVWSLYADALQKLGQLDRALAALDSTAARDPDYANIAARKGKWLLEQGRVTQALPAFREAIRRGEQPQDVIAQLLIAHGHEKGVTPKDYAYAIRIFEMAREFAEQPKTKEMRNFWHGYALYQSAVQQQEPQTLESARKTLPMFQEALSLFENSKNYAASQPSIDLARFLSAAKTYIEIQEAIIKRGR